MIVLDDDMSINEIQEVFSKRYPFLKLVFYHLSDSFNPGPETHLPIKNMAKKISDYRKSYKKGVHQISEYQTVSEIEKIFKEQYNLLAFIFRKSGKSWLETTITGHWELEKQNSEGEKLSAHGI